MDETITAIYENGVLRLLTPLALPEHTKVQIQIQAPSFDDTETHRRKVIAALVAAGLTLPTLDTSSAMPLSEAERDELARIIPPGRSLSEIIIEEREGR